MHMESELSVPVLEPPCTAHPGTDEPPPEESGIAGVQRTGLKPERPTRGACSAKEVKREDTEEVKREGMTQYEGEKRTEQ
jgi:hypothetical protein